MSKTAEYWINSLALKPHPEGGYYREVYRSEEELKQHSLPLRYAGDRAFATSIFFLLKNNQISAFHRIQSDETWHCYAGVTLELFVLQTDGSLAHLLLGSQVERGEYLQVTIPRQHWFAARLVEQQGYALLGCTVAPGFHFDDFELANRKELIDRYPKHAEIISALTYD
ncbi:MAG: cupin domain-containing protein [Cyclobacteriaceae bacterium]|nr:cupin domain-containing protein [Cyclobacteriaceae bacterium]